ncbi:unnamed protein product [Tenebrio molitor]|nr:unnamed protein product [Tenebrio molitor]
MIRSKHEGNGGRTSNLRRLESLFIKNAVLQQWQGRNAAALKQITTHVDPIGSY